MVALCFNVEEFNSPTAHGGRLPLVKQMSISSEGLVLVLDLLEGLGVRATFFVSPNFAEHRPALVQRIQAGKHTTHATPLPDMLWSTAPIIRRSLSCATLHQLPIDMYLGLCHWTLRRDKKLTIYFNIWEFASVLHYPDYRVPSSLAKNSGPTLVKRLSIVLNDLKNKRHLPFVSLDEFAHDIAE